MKPNPADPSTPTDSPRDIGSHSTRWQGYFIQVRDKRQTDMHILNFYARQFNIQTAVILSHVHGKEGLSLSLRVPSDLSSARKTSIQAQNWILAQHTTYCTMLFYSFKIQHCLPAFIYRQLHLRTQSKFPCFNIVRGT